ncbi:MAG: hypothetical protein WDM92_04140 [Caulobacteraceae bacterium]
MLTDTVERSPTLLKDGVSVESLVDADKGKISRRLYADAELYELEQEQIFRRAWGFLAHESELKNPGDYVARELAGEPSCWSRATTAWSAPS